MDGPKRLITSRRFMRLLPWLSALVLIVGVGVFLGTHYSNTAKVEPSNPTGAPIPAAVPQKNIPFPQAAWRVAREFVFTALPRKNLAESYAITHPELKSGYTLKQWESGTLPFVPYFPTAQVLKWNWKNTNYSHPREAQINVILLATQSSHMRPSYAQIVLKKVGAGSQARWLVSYFQPLGGVPVPTPK